jgi:phosphopantothenoylcysteine decarboxylase/phosphopantothenate--cysteine ligase
MLLDGKRVLVGVGGSISAYRACDVVRALKKLGAQVRVAPTRAACAFVTPLTFEALSGAPVLGSVLDVEDGRIPHIEEAYAADVVVVAPASADLLARMAHGLADEALLATLLSFRGPLVVAPAMETRMWEHDATQDNVRVLVSRGAHIVGPDDGALGPHGSRSPR